MSTEIPTTKVCKACDRDLPLSAFAKHAKCKFGVVGTCKSCKAKAPRPDDTKHAQQMRNVNCYRQIYYLTNDADEQTIKRIIADCCHLPNEKKSLLRRIEYTTGVPLDVLDEYWKCSLEEKRCQLEDPAQDGT